MISVSGDVQYGVGLFTRKAQTPLRNSGAKEGQVLPAYPKDGGADRRHRDPNHISKTVLSIVKKGPPTYTVDRTVFDLWLGGL